MKGILAGLGAMIALASCAPHPQPSNDTVFVSNEAGYVTLIDGATGRIEGRLATGPRPRGMAFSPDRRTFYVAASDAGRIDRKSTRLNSSHVEISYAVFCLKKKNKP